MAIAGAAAWWLSAPQPLYAAGSSVLEAGGDAARGRIVFDAGGCAACHATPGQDDRLRLGGGLELKSPYGSFFAPNISPDPTDGIGRWKVADLVNALQAGVSPTGAHYYPALPYATYAHATLGDMRDLMAFLRTLEPVKGRASPHSLRFPFNIRRALGLWKRLYLDHAPVANDPAQTPEWNRGHYLVTALSHCAECHSARTLLGGIDERYRFAGGPDLDGDGWVPNITQSGNGIGEWSKGDILEVLTSGQTPDFDAVGGSMVAVVRNTSQLPQADREAMAAYIKSLPAREGPPKPPKKD
jgi:mono/diheme cytochrome c family protein